MNQGLPTAIDKTIKNMLILSQQSPEEGENVIFQKVEPPNPPKEAFEADIANDKAWRILVATLKILATALIVGLAIGLATGKFF